MILGAGLARKNSGRVRSTQNKQPSFDQLARLLAGMDPGGAGDRFSRFRRLKIWKDHSELFDQAYRSFEAEYAVPFFQWARKNVECDRSVSAVFYPFSGPDFAFAHLLYPGADVYILCGLEPCRLPAGPLFLNKASIGNALEGLRTAVGHFLSYSYFTTKEMRELFPNLFLPGTVLALLTLLARMGMRICSVAFIELCSDQESVPGVRIDFESAGRSRRVFYFQQDLRDTFFSDQGAFSKFVESSGQFGVLIKSASYLLHESNFSNLRKFVLQGCSTLVQDPSGIPFRAFDEGFSLTLHGHYTGTLPSFRKYEQPELAHGYATNPSSELDFGFGYFHKVEQGSLMLATVCALSQRMG